MWCFFDSLYLTDQYVTIGSVYDVGVHRLEADPHFESSSDWSSANPFYPVFQPERDHVLCR